MLTKLMGWLGLRSREKVCRPMPTPVVLERSQHKLSRRDISKHALKVLYRLHDAGYQAYLVGGGVRDILLGRHPKDFDLVTNAHPEEISNLFRNSRLIGRRFRLVHVHFGAQIVEVATFRAEHPEAKDLDPSMGRSGEDGMLIRDNIYGTFEEDIWRRDFTVNAIYYNIADFSLIDYVGGLADLETHTLRMIGDPAARYREDPVRMLRAVRFAAKLDFTLHKNTEAPLYELAPLLTNVPGARLFDEYIKLFLSGHALASFHLLRRYKLFSILFPATEECLNEGTHQVLIETFLNNAFQNTDQRVLEDKPVAPPFLLAALLWYPLRIQANKLMEEGQMSESMALFEAHELILREQRRSFAIPRRLTQIVRDIWSFQTRLQRRSGIRAAELHSHSRFRAAYDFLILRAQSGDEKAKILADWWTTYIASDETQRNLMANSVQRAPQKRRRRPMMAKKIKSGE